MQEQEIVSQSSSQYFSMGPINTPKLESIFTMRQQNAPDILANAKLFENHIVLQPNLHPDQNELNHKDFKIELDFDTIFSILKNNQTDDQQKTHSGSPYAIKIEKYNQSVELHSESGMEIYLWEVELAKKLNQRNFHKLFKPIKKIGKGNFASVYLVFKYHDNTEYAVKAFSKEIQYSEERGKQALENQINIMRSLDNKYLMKIQGVYETENSLYMCVEYLSGGILFDKIKKRHKFSLDEIKTIMKCLLEGVSAMHKKGIMHRDLKPENIILRDQFSNECVIADFGLATFANADNYIFTRCGTPGYVAPEISNLKNQQKYDPICDIFSLGVIFHILLLGKSPFPGAQCDEVLKQNRQCNIDFSQHHFQKLRPSALDLLQKMVKKNPAHRISAQQAMCHEFFSYDSEIIPQEMCNKSISSKQSECDSPLMISKNPKRKRNMKLRDDSCLKFKMRENMYLNEEGEEILDKINSPGLINRKIQRGKNQRKAKTLMPSNFKS